MMSQGIIPSFTSIVQWLKGNWYYVLGGMGLTGVPDILITPSLYNSLFPYVLLADSDCHNPTASNLSEEEEKEVCCAE